MPEPIDLSTVIEDAISDATLPEDTSSDLSVDSSVEAPDTSTGDSVESPVDEGQSIEVASPAARGGEEEASGEEGDEAATQGDFVMDKELGIPSHTNGRENRIPYSRVQKIVARQRAKAVEPLQKQLEELTPKVQAYEQQLQSVAQFEQVMVNEPRKFLDMLAQIPSYQPFFQMLEQLSAQVQQQAQNQEQVVDNDPMPQPGEDGLYDMEGLQKLLEWNARQVEARTLQQVESRYQPIREQWEAQQRMQMLVPQVERQIAEARTWPLFNESEEEIVQVLNANPGASLEQAYRSVVFPKLQAQRDKIRQEVLAEIKKAPTASSAPTQRVKPVQGPAQSSGPRDLEDIIREQIAPLNGR